MILWLAKKLILSNPAMTLDHAKRLVKVGLIVVLALALFGLFLWLGAREEADDKANQDIGAAVQREGDLRETIERTEQGNAARTEIEEGIVRDDGRDAAVYAQCVRTARTPANCERFLPERPADQR